MEPASAPHPFLSEPPATATTGRPNPPSSARLHYGSLPTHHAVTTIDIDITEACNLGCVYCFKSELYGKYMTWSTLTKALDWLLAASGGYPEVNCNFMGGEPTLRWNDIARFVPWAIRRGRSRNKRVTFSMTSNMTLWTEEIRRFVDMYNFGVLMSIDGAPDVQDAQRPSKNGKPVSETVAHWAKSMLRTRPHAMARATVHPTFVHRLHDSYRYLAELGFQLITFAASDYSAWTDRAFVLCQQALSHCEQDMRRALQHGTIVHISAIQYYLKKLVIPRHESGPESIVYMKQPCGAGKGYMMIDYAGDVWPCHRFDGADTDKRAGGVFRLANIFQDGFHTELHKAFLSFDHSTMQKPACRTCPVEPACGGYCPAANFSDTGSIYTPHDSYCRWSQMLYATAEQLYAHSREDGTLDVLRRSVVGAESDGR